MWKKVIRDLIKPRSSGKLSGEGTFMLTSSVGAGTEKAKVKREQMVTVVHAKALREPGVQCEGRWGRAGKEVITVIRSEMQMPFGGLEKGFDLKMAEVTWSYTYLKIMSENAL